MSIDPQAVRAIVEIGAGIVLVAGPLMLIWYYVTRQRQGDPVGIGLRAIQIIVAVMAAPTVIILSLEHVIQADVVGTLLGALLGYVLSPKD